MEQQLYDSKGEAPGLKDANSHLTFICICVTKQRRVSPTSIQRWAKSLRMNKTRCHAWLAPFCPFGCFWAKPVAKSRQANNSNVNTNMKLAMNKRNINYNFNSPF
jgi:hypothetical protein